MRYIYPDNMKSKASLFLWRLRDMIAIILGVILSITAIATIHFVYPLALVAAYAFLSIRLDDKSICDYITYAFQFCVSKQQLFYWRCKNEFD